MQLHRNHTTTLIDFATSLEKVAKVTAQDLILRRQAESQVKQLRASEDKYAPAKAFARGAGVSFALPLAYSLFNFDRKGKMKELKNKGQSAYDQFYIKHGLMEGGVTDADASALAKMVVKNQTNFVDPNNPGVVPDIQIKAAIKQNVKKELAGGTPSQFTKGYSGSWKVSKTNNPTINLTNSAIASGKSVDKKGAIDIQKQISATYFGGQKDPDVPKQFIKHFVEPTADHIMRTEYKGVGGSGLLKRTQFMKLHDAGSAAVKKKGIAPFNVGKYQMSELKKILMGKLKTPATLGILGGIAAVNKNKKNREEYKGLLSEVRRRNARR